ncbi:hypothetical protein STEG23_025341, partial [Scotinomys teguina]
MPQEPRSSDTLCQVFSRAAKTLNDLTLKVRGGENPLNHVQVPSSLIKVVGIAIGKAFLWKNRTELLGAVDPEQKGAHLEKKRSLLGFVTPAVDCDHWFTQEGQSLIDNRVSESKTRQKLSLGLFDVADIQARLLHILAQRCQVYATCETLALLAQKAGVTFQTHSQLWNHDKCQSPKVEHASLLQLLKLRDPSPPLNVDWGQSVEDRTLSFIFKEENGGPKGSSTEKEQVCSQPKPDRHLLMSHFNIL